MPSAPVAVAAALLMVSGEMLGTYGRASEVLSDTIKIDLRAKLWKDSITRAAEHPWTGFGRGVLCKKIPQQQGLINHIHAHNIVLNYALQLGFLGPIVLGLLVFSVIRELLKITRPVDRDVGTLGVAGLAIVCGVIGVEAMIEVIFVRHLG
jgi:O-antigen ligase